MNFNQFLKQANQMQQKMQEMQEQIANKEFIGKSGGGLVAITINGRSEMKKVEIDPSLLVPEEKEIFEDLIIAAFNDAKQKADQESQASISNAFGNIPLPPGFKIPF